jgi:hypothetical protein
VAPAIGWREERALPDAPRVDVPGPSHERPADASDGLGSALNVLAGDVGMGRNAIGVHRAEFGGRTGSRNWSE